MQQCKNSPSGENRWGCCVWNENRLEHALLVHGLSNLLEAGNIGACN